MAWTRCGASLLEQQAPLVQRLAHEADVETLEVAQAAVDQLAGAARRAGGEVALLDQSHRQAAAGGVEGDAAAGHAAADHQHVERLRRETLQSAPRGHRGRAMSRARQRPPVDLRSQRRDCRGDSGTGADRRRVTHAVHASSKTSGTCHSEESITGRPSSSKSTCSICCSGEPTLHVEQVRQARVGDHGTQSRKRRAHLDVHRLEQLVERRVDRRRRPPRRAEPSGCGRSSTRRAGRRPCGCARRTARRPPGRSPGRSPRRSSAGRTSWRSSLRPGSSPASRIMAV